MKIWRQEVYESNEKIQLTYSRQSMKEIIIDGDFVFAYNIRGIGKTILLNEIAKEKGWKVLSRTLVSDVLRGANYKYLIDDTVDYNELPDYIKERVVGGFTQYTNANQLKLVNMQKESESIKSNEDVDILLILKQNAKTLAKKIEESVRRGDDGTTRNLINNLSGILSIVEKYDSNFTLTKE